MFDRLINLIGEDNLEKIKKSNVVLVGVGGVGGFVLEALVRSGITKITIYDNDCISLSNLNRQIISNIDNIDNEKVKEAKKRIKKINPDVKLKIYNTKISNENIDILKDFDYIIDACDDVLAKVAMIKYAKENAIKIICALGTGKRLDPTHIELTTLDKTYNDPLAKKIRNLLGKEKIKQDIPVVYASNKPLNNDVVIASCIFPPAVAGIYMAYYVIDDIIKE